MYINPHRVLASGTLVVTGYEHMEFWIWHWGLFIIVMRVCGWISSRREWVVRVYSTLDILLVTFHGEMSSPVVVSYMEVLRDSS